MRPAIGSPQSSTVTGPSIVRPPENSVLVALAQFADGDGECYVTQPVLAQMTAYSLSVVDIALADLEAAGYIARARRYGGRLTEGWRLVPGVEADTRDPAVPAGG